MYIPDGTSWEYGHEFPGRKAIQGEPYSCLVWDVGRYNFGWLGDYVPEGSVGWSDSSEKQRVLDRLASLKPILMHRGFHVCEICQNTIKTNHGWNGSFVFEKEHIHYRCPASVGHYIEAHNYNPGSEVVDAILNGRVVGEKEELESIRGAVEDDREQTDWVKSASRTMGRMLEEDK